MIPKAMLTSLGSPMELTENDVRDLIPMDGGARDSGGESSDEGGEELMVVEAKEVKGGGGGDGDEGRDVRCWQTWRWTRPKGGTRDRGGGRRRGGGDGRSGRGGRGERGRRGERARRGHGERGGRGGGVYHLGVLSFPDSRSVPRSFGY